MLTRVGVPVEVEAEPSAPDPEPATLLCFSHLRWNFVYQRPQHLLSRFAKNYTVYFIEEPMYHGDDDYNNIVLTNDNIRVVTPYLKHHEPVENFNERMSALLGRLIQQENIHNYFSWYYSPLAFLYSNHLQPSLIVYDCMDELSAFKFASLQLKEAEDQLFRKADIVFTGGYSLFYAKKCRHPNIHAFPSSIEKEHF